MYKIWSYPQQVRVTKFTSTQQQSDVHQHSTMIGKVHLPFSNKPSHFLPQPDFSMSSSASLSSFDVQPQNLIPFSRHDPPLSSTHDHTNEQCHSQQNHSLIQTQLQHQIHRSFSVLQLYFTHCSHHGYLCPSQNSHLTFLQAPCITAIKYCWPNITHNLI